MSWVCGRNFSYILGICTNTIVGKTILLLQQLRYIIFKVAKIVTLTIMNENSSTISFTLLPSAFTRMWTITLQLYNFLSCCTSFSHNSILFYLIKAPYNIVKPFVIWSKFQNEANHKRKCWKVKIIIYLLNQNELLLEHKEKIFCLK